MDKHLPVGTSNFIGDSWYRFGNLRRWSVWFAPCVSLRLTVVGEAEGKAGDFPHHETTGHSALCDSPEKGRLEGIQWEASHG